MLYLEHSGLSETGKVRDNNEDDLLLGEGRDETLFAVADGIGGSEAGEVASSRAVETLGELSPGEPFGSAIEEANRRILREAEGNERLSGMGTTVVAVRFSGPKGEPKAEVAHVGDSRAYLLRGEEMVPLTEDHSLVAEMVRSGELSREEAAEHPQRNLITRALGVEEEVEAETSTLSVEADDRLLLCSDGLTDLVPEQRLAEVLSESSEEPETPARRLVSEALEAGGKDNITVVVVDIREHTPVQEHSGGSSSGTREMEPVPMELAPSPANQRTSRKDYRKARRTAKSSARRRRGRRGILPDKLSALVRGLAALAVVAAALTPVYLWGESRYFLGFEGGEVVAYQGLPYSILDVKLYEECQEEWCTRLDGDVPELYREPIEDHKLYSEERAEEVISNLESS